VHSEDLSSIVDVLLPAVHSEVTSPINCCLFPVVSIVLISCCVSSMCGVLIDNRSYQCPRQLRGVVVLLLPVCSLQCSGAVECSSIHFLVLLIRQP
jgi:hypothetical protein